MTLIGDVLGDPSAMLIFIGLPAYVILYVFGCFKYSVESKRFVVRWSILGFIPIYRASFPLDQLLCVRRFRWPRDFFSLATPLGNTFSSNRAIVEFGGWRRRSLAVTPRSFDDLSAALSDYRPGAHGSDDAATGSGGRAGA
jgi:hypothetical protein